MVDSCVLLTRSRCQCIVKMYNTQAFHLHVLGLLHAFILSQDQTRLFLKCQRLGLRTSTASKLSCFETT